MIAIAIESLEQIHQEVFSRGRETINRVVFGGPLGEPRVFSLESIEKSGYFWSTAER